MVHRCIPGLHPSSRRTALFVPVSLFLWLGSVLQAASTTYTPVILYPLNLPPGSIHDVNIFGAARGQVIGTVQFAPGGAPSDIHATLWNGGPSPIDLGAGWSGVATDGTQQLGTGSYDHVVLWTGSAASAVSLGLGFPTAVGGGEQVGYGGTDALLWHGTAGSVVMLGGNDSSANGTDGIHQVGSMGVMGAHAMLWSGTAASAVDLHPTQIQGITGPGGVFEPLYASVAQGVSGAQQVGQAYFVSNLRIENPIEHAMLWNGTAASAVDLNPTSQGYVFSYAIATNGTVQVGFGTKAIGRTGVPLAWSGTADSAVDLQALLPPKPGYSYAYATSVDSFGDVFGWATKQPPYGLNKGPFYAVEWLPHAVVPGDANLDGKVDLSDLLTLGRNYGRSGGWLQGDFDNDGTVDFDDLILLARHYGETFSQTSPAILPEAVVVPEPSGMFACLPLLALLIRTRYWTGDSRFRLITQLSGSWISKRSGRCCMN